MSDYIALFLGEIYLDESKWKRLLATGRLPKAALRKIQQYKGKADPLYVKQLLKQGKQQQATAYLKKRGIVKSARVWLVGIEKGTQNILKRYNAKVLHKPDVSFTKGVKAMGIGIEKDLGLKSGKTMKQVLGAHAKVQPGAGKARVHVATNVKKKEQGLATIVKRHEGDEVRAATRQMKKSKVSKGTAVPVGAGHMSADVLRNEKEIVRTAKALYGKKAGGKQMHKFRTDSGEYKFISKKRISRRDEKEARTAMIKAMRSQKKSFAKMEPAERRDYLKTTQDELKKILSTRDVKKVMSFYSRA